YHGLRHSWSGAWGVSGDGYISFVPGRARECDRADRTASLSRDVCADLACRPGADRMGIRAIPGARMDSGVVAAGVYAARYHWANAIRDDLHRRRFYSQPHQDSP